MKPIHFRGENYDPMILSKLVGLGHRVSNVPNENIIELISEKSISVVIGIEVDNKYHILTGMIDRKNPTQSFTAISKHVLKRAKIQTTVHAERTQSEHQKTYDRERRGQGFQSYNRF